MSLAFQQDRKMVHCLHAFVLAALLEMLPRVSVRVHDVEIVMKKTVKVYQYSGDFQETSVATTK